MEHKGGNWLVHCSMPKGTSRAEATSNSDKTKLVVLAVIELCLAEGIEKKIPFNKFFFKNSVATF